MKNIFAVLTALLITLFSLTSCEKKTLTENGPASQVQTPTTPGTGTTARMTNTNGWTTYWIDQAYENNYVHTCQLTASLSGNKECAPTAYMLAAHMLLGSSYPSSTAKLNAIVSRLTGTFGWNPYYSISQLASYLSGTDYPTIKGYTTSQPNYYTTSRSSFKSMLENYLTNGFPVIVPVNLRNYSSTIVNSSNYTTESQSVNPDIDGSDVSGRTYYLSGDKDDDGHFIVVIGIKVNNSTGGGYVYYKDPLASSGTTKIASYERFLNSALANGKSYTAYDALPLSK